MSGALLSFGRQSPIIDFRSYQMQVPCDAHFACQSRCSVISRDTDISGKVSYWILISYQPQRVTPEDEQTPSLVSAHLKLFSI